MSISNLRRVRPSKTEGKRNGASAAYVLPPTVSCDALMQRGSDRRFRVLVQDLFTIAARMESVREHFGRWMGISGPQYSLMVAIAHMQGADGVNVGAVARALHVSSAFIASESGKLARRGLLLKRTSPHDRRGVLLSVAPAGRSKIDGISKQIRTVNDLFFGVLGSASFAAVSSAAGALVESSVRAIQYLDAVEAKPKVPRRAMDAACASPRQRVPTKRACEISPVWQRRTNGAE
jgi:DNA-binding MarR family transcriptional regulator